MALRSLLLAFVGGVRHRRLGLVLAIARPANDRRSADARGRFGRRRAAGAWLLEAFYGCDYHCRGRPSVAGHRAGLLVAELGEGSTRRVMILGFV